MPLQADPSRSSSWLTYFYDPEQAQAQSSLYGAQTAQAGALGAKSNFLTGLLGSGNNSFGTLQKLLGLFGGAGGGSSSSGSSSGGVPSGYGDLTNQLLGQLNQMGQGRTNEINQQFTDTTNTAVSRLQDRGIGTYGNTFAVTANQGAERDRQRALTDLNDSLAGQKTNVLSNVGLAGLQSADRSRFAQQDLGNDLMSKLLGGLLDF